jgi:hypothetical protein
MEPPEVPVTDQVYGAPFPPTAVKVCVLPTTMVAVAGVMETAVRTEVAGEVVAAAETAVPVIAAVPFAVAVKVRVPTPEVRQENVKATVEPAAIADEGGAATPQVAEAPPPPVTVGMTATPFATAAVAVAVFWTLAVRATDWPALTQVGSAPAKATVKAGAWTAIAAEVGFVLCGTRGRFASTQIAYPEIDRVCAVEGAVQPVHVRTCVAAMLFTGIAGATVQKPA